MKRTRQRKLILTVIVIIIVVAVAITYVLPLAVMAETSTPPPDQGDGGFGMGAGEFDDSTLPPFPGAEDTEEETKNPQLIIPESTIRLDIGQRYQIPIEKRDIPDNTFLEWRSDNQEVVVVGQDGTIQAVAPGNAAIYVSATVDAEKPPVSTSVLVTVNELRASGVEIRVPDDIAATGNDSYELKVGDVKRFSAVVTPDGAKVDTLTWTLGNKEIAALTSDGRTCEFVAEAVGQTQLSVAADSLSDAIVINIVESGVPIDTIWDYVMYGIIIIVVIVAVVVILTYLSQKKKKEQARQRAAAKRRKEKEEEERRIREAVNAGDMRELRPVQSEERATMKISGSGVGAGLPGGDGREKPERPLTLDDLD